jgi:hypothetical protein
LPIRQFGPRAARSVCARASAKSEPRGRAQNKQTRRGVCELLEVSPRCNRCPAPHTHTRARARERGEFSRTARTILERTEEPHAVQYPTAQTYTMENFQCHFTVSDPTRSATVHAHAAWRSVPVRRARRLRTCLPHERLSDTARQRQTSHLTTAYRGHAECSTPLGCLCRWHGCMRRCIPLQATRSNIT